MFQFGSKHVCIEDVHIFKHCREMTLFLLWIGTYCISCVVQQTSGVKDLSSLVRYDHSSLAAVRHVQSNITLVQPRPNIRSHSVLLYIKIGTLTNNYGRVLYGDRKFSLFFPPRVNASSSKHQDGCSGQKIKLIDWPYCAS